MSGSMRLRAIAAVAMVMIQLSTVGLGGFSGQQASAQDDSFAAAAPNRYIVRLKESGGFTSAASVASAYDAEPGVTIDQVYTEVFSGFAGEFSPKAAAELANDPNVLDVFPDRASTIQAQTNPPGIDRIDADLNPTVAGNGSGSVNADVAILDTGVYKHPDLNVVGGKDCSNSKQTDQYTDINGHGTHVAGSVAAVDNGSGVVGVAPGARIWAVKIFSDNGGGYTYESEIICGLDYVRSKASTIEVANMSIGGNYGSNVGGCSATAYHQAVCRLVSAGVTVVVAAGNDGQNTNTYVPAQFPEVITVSAYHDSDGKPGALGGYNFNWSVNDDAIVYFSNYGSAVDIAAPGVDILSTASAYAGYDYCPMSGYCVESGTSMASPHVAGAAALMRAQQGTMSPATVRARLIQSAEPGPLPGDPDSNKEPLLNVAQLGKGSISSPTSAKVGETIQVRIGGFTPNTRVLFRFDGTYMGGDTVDDAGRAHRNFKVPASAKGSHEITVSNGLKTVKKTITVNPSVGVSPSSGPVDETVNISLRGFAKGELVTVKYNTGAANVTVVTSKATSSSGSANVSFKIPASTKGAHTFTATGNKGSSATGTYTVKQTAYVSSGTPTPGNKVRVQYRGYVAGQTVTMRFDTQSGTVLGTGTASATGSGSLLVTIPATTNGTHYIWVMSAGGNIRVTLTVSGAGLPTPPTPTPTVEPTSTPAPTDVPPTEVPTEVPTDVPTEVPTEIPTEVPTEVPTDVPTDVPTETPVVEVPTETPTPEV